MLVQEAQERRQTGASASAPTEKPPLPPSARPLVTDKVLAVQRHVSTPDADSHEAAESAEARRSVHSGESQAEPLTQGAESSQPVNDESAWQEQSARQLSTAADFRRVDGAQAQVCMEPL